MSTPPVVDRETWLKARLEHLHREKELTRLRDAVSRERRALPWVRVDKAYRFQSADGEQSLADLFGPHSQLIVYHFMFHADWQQGCKACSFIADSYAGAETHLAARDVSLVTVSQAPPAQIEAFRSRMGWSFPWVSAHGSDFNRDFHVSFTEAELAGGSAYYNYREAGFTEVEAPGISAFIRDGDDICHTYSSYGRGLDMFITAYHLLDIAPHGRDEQDLPYSMAWIRHHDRYGSEDEGFH